MTEKLKPCPFCGCEFDLDSGLMGFGEEDKSCLYRVSVLRGPNPH